MIRFIALAFLVIANTAMAWKVILDEPQKAIIFDWNATISLDLLEEGHVFYVKPQIKKLDDDFIAVFEIEFSQEIIKKYSFEYELCQESPLMKIRLLETATHENYAIYNLYNDGYEAYRRFHSLAWRSSGVMTKTIKDSLSGRLNIFEQTTERESEYFGIEIKQRINKTLVALAEASLVS